MKMWHIDARRYAAINGTINAVHISLRYAKYIKMAWRLGLNKLLDKLPGHFTQKNRHMTHNSASLSTD